MVYLGGQSYPDSHLNPGVTLTTLHYNNLGGIQTGYPGHSKIWTLYNRMVYTNWIFGLIFASLKQHSDQHFFATKFTMMDYLKIFVLADFPTQFNCILCSL